MSRFLAFGFAAAFAFAGTASAQVYYGDRYDDSQAVYDYAEVLEVEAIFEDGYSEPVYREVCWDEPVTYREPARYVRPRGSEASAVLGAIIGGVIGHNLGNGGHGYRAAYRDRMATTAGAALGYAIVRDAQGGGHVQGGRVVTRHERRCEMRPEYPEEQRISGYDVTYRYRGRIYHTVTDYDPGTQLRVRVDVSAAP